MEQFSFLNKEAVIKNLTSQFEKGNNAQIGEIRVWADGKKHQKVGPDKWIDVKEDSKKKLHFDGNLVGPEKYGSPRFAKDLNTSVSTEHQYSNGITWSPIRVERTHKPIVKSYKARGKKNPNGVKTAILMMGAPASGKGSLQTELRERGLIENHILSIDPDEIKVNALKPDYDRYLDVNPELAADKVHKESIYINNRIVDTMKKNEFDFLEDRCFANYYLLKDEIDSLARHGYKVKIYMAKLPFDEGMKRMLNRAKGKDERTVPEDAMKVRYAAIDDTWNKLVRDLPKNVVSAIQYDTMDTKKLKVLEKYGTE